MASESGTPKRPSDHERFSYWAEQDFVGPGRMTPPDASTRGATALEFIAFRIGRIDDKLGRMIELLEKQQGDR